MTSSKKGFDCEHKNTCPEVDRLKGELAYVRFELEGLKRRLYKKHLKDNPPKMPGAPQVTPKKKGALLGHIGWFRPRPKDITRIEEVRLNTCPECGSTHITECKEVEEHIQEDITLPKVEVTLYRRHHYYCKHCKCVVSAKGKEELHRSRIGPKARSFGIFLNHVVKVSKRDVAGIFQKAFNLSLTAPSLTGFKDRLKDEALPIYKSLVDKLKYSRLLHIDETGWPMDGKNYWLWKFCNKTICVSHIDKSRGQKVVESMIGKNYNGILVSDFLSAYNKIETRAKQRCLVHLLRDLKKVLAYFQDDPEVLRYSRRLKKILENAILLYKEYMDKEWDEKYYSKRARINDTLKDFNFPNPNKRILKRFAKRLKRHKGEILTFLYEKGVDYHNNHAEQQIRPDVIFRKVTFGSRSLKGAENHSVLATILQTAKLNNLDPIKTLEDILLNKNKDPFEKILSPPDNATPFINSILVNRNEEALLPVMC
jgi:hypothetical protein